MGLGLFCCCLLPVVSSLNAAATAAFSPPRDLSFHNEVLRAIDRGFARLQTNQNSNGWWSTPDQPALTALALTAFKGDPRHRYSSNEPAWLRKGYSFVLSCVNRTAESTHQSRHLQHFDFDDRAAGGKPS
jgi:hypothetical protein